MSDTTTRFATAHPNIVTELFDDEMVVVDFDTGRYFSVDVVGAEIFNLLAAHHTVDEVAASLAHHFTDDATRVTAVVADFAAELTAALLLIPEATARPSGAAAPSRDLPSGPIPVPTLTGYTDMQDLLMLDPIHDVADTGWPARHEPS